MTTSARYPAALLFRTVLLMIVLSCRTGASLAAPGDEGWGDEFGTPGANGTVHALLAVSTDLYAAGSFTRMDGIPLNRIGRWDGSAWHALGAGFNGPVYALATWQGQLIAGGSFTMADGQPAARIARWDGASWHPLAGGLNNTVVSLVEWNGLLAAGGLFTTAGGNSAVRVATWNGAAWSALGAGLSAEVKALDVLDGMLVAGGLFSSSGGTPVGSVARWNGSSWTPIGPLTESSAYDIAVWNGRLFAATGCFAVVEWNGTSWSGGACSGFPYMYCVAPGGDRLLYGGYLTFGSEFGDDYSPPGWMDAVGNYQELPGLNGPVLAATYYGGRWIYAGSFLGSRTTPGRSLMAWDGTVWAPLVPIAKAQGVSKPPHVIGAIGNQVLVGGDLARCGTTSMYGFGTWNGSAWTAHDLNVNFTRYDGGRLVRAKANYADQLVIGGTFHLTASNGGATSIVWWDGATWTVPPYEQFPHPFGYRDVTAAGIYANDLVVAGQFTTMGTLPASGIARFNGTTWNSFAVGLNVYGDMTGIVEYGSHLYISGGFQTQTTPTLSGLARWTGTTWQSVGGAGPGIEALAAYGGLLYAAGTFTSINGQPFSRIAAWNGTSWQAVGTGVAGSNFPRVSSMIVHGNRLFVAGSFTSINGVPAANVAAFDGNSWQPLGSGTNGSIQDMASTGSDLYLIGGFTEAGGKNNTYVARWRDQPVAVIGATVRVGREAEACRLHWQVEDAASASAYRVYRASGSGVRTPATNDRFAGRAEYDFLDLDPPRDAFEYWLEEVSRLGESQWYGPYAVAAAPAVPLTLSASPNPFRGRLVIQLGGTIPPHATIDVFDLVGRRIRRLGIASDTMDREVDWDGLMDDGRRAASGHYLIRVESEGSPITLPVVLVR